MICVHILAVKANAAQEKNIYFNELHHNVVKFVEICLLSYMSTCFGSKFFAVQLARGVHGSRPEHNSFQATIYVSNTEPVLAHHPAT